MIKLEPYYEMMNIKSNFYLVDWRKLKKLKRKKYAVLLDEKYGIYQSTPIFWPMSVSPSIINIITLSPTTIGINSDIYMRKSFNHVVYGFHVKGPVDGEKDNHECYIMFDSKNDYIRWKLTNA